MVTILAVRRFAWAYFRVKLRRRTVESDAEATRQPPETIEGYPVPKKIGEEFADQAGEVGAGASGARMFGGSLETEERNCRATSMVLSE